MACVKTTREEGKSSAVRRIVPETLDRMAAALLILAIHLFFAPVPAQAAQGAGWGRIALFPFVNLSDDRSAVERVMPVIRGILEERGLDLVGEEDLNDFLLRERVRDTGYASRELAAKAGRDLGAAAVLLGSVNSFRLGKNPAVGFTARLIDSTDGRILWAEHASATGDDFTGILGLGRIDTMDSLIPAVARRLLASLPPARPYAAGKAHPYRVAVMPFRNNSGVSDAGMIATYMFLVELFRNPEYEPVEYGDVRRAIVELRVRERGELDFEDMKGLASILPVDGFLVGTVETYSDGSDTSSPPEALITARLLDARTNRVLWCDSLQMNGDDDIIVLDWGKIRSVDGVAFRIVSGLLERAAKACREKLPPPAARSSGPKAASRNTVPEKRVPVVSKPPPEEAGGAVESTTIAPLPEEDETDEVSESARRSPPDVSRTEVFFDYDSSEIGRDAYRRLRALADSLRGRSIKAVSIEGHACAHGPAWYNYRISRERALAVKRFLVENADIPEDAIEVSYFGEERLLYPERPESESVRAPEVRKNRRVIVTVVYGR